MTTQEWLDGLQIEVDKWQEPTTDTAYTNIEVMSITRQLEEIKSRLDYIQKLYLHWDNVTE